MASRHFLLLPARGQAQLRLAVGLPVVVDVLAFGGPPANDAFPRVCVLRVLFFPRLDIAQASGAETFRLPFRTHPGFFCFIVSGSGTADGGIFAKHKPGKAGFCRRREGLPAAARAMDFFHGEEKIIRGERIHAEKRLLGGHPQMTLFLVYAFSAYYFFLAWTSRKQVELKHSVYRFGLILVFFVLLSLVQVLPTAEFLQNTSRGKLGFAAAAKDSLPPRALWTFFMADLFLPTYESWQFWEFRCYMSVGGILLAALGLFTRPGGQAAFFRVLAVAALILALGENTPIYEAFYTLVPGFKFFRVPARFLLLFVFAVSVLAAYGFSAFAGDGSKPSEPKRGNAAKKFKHADLRSVLYARPGV